MAGQMALDHFAGVRILSLVLMNNNETSGFLIIYNEDGTIERRPVIRRTLREEWDIQKEESE